MDKTGSGNRHEASYSLSSFLRGNIQVREYRPGLIPKETVDALVSIAIRSFGNGMGREEVVEHIMPNDLVLVVYDDGEPAGFAGLKRGRKGRDSALLLKASVLDYSITGRWRLQADNQGKDTPRLG
ncbi:MAG: hypothetical protein KGH60_05080 [Candidatus Micrarchaeota archaeon]|nr:hypothetical protein [Candidatus Micrarchaeota archaeon]